MRPTHSIGEARALATLAFARAVEIDGIDVVENRALVNEYQKHRGNVKAQKDFYDFQSLVLKELKGQAREALKQYLDDAGLNKGDPTAQVPDVTSRGQQILGFARGCEIGGINAHREAEALKVEYQGLRRDLTPAEQSELEAFLKERASPEAWAAIHG